MDKRSKNQRHKSLSREELADLGPGRASFDTEEGRAAQGMRPDIGQPGRADEPRDKPPTPDNPPAVEDVT